MTATIDGPKLCVRCHCTPDAACEAGCVWVATPPEMWYLGNLPRAIPAAVDVHDLGLCSECVRPEDPEPIRWLASDAKIRMLRVEVGNVADLLALVAYNINPAILERFGQPPDAGPQIVVPH